MSAPAGIPAPPPARRTAAGLRLAATVGVLLLGEAVLWRAGSELPSLPLDRAGLSRTFGEAEPLAFAVALLRVVALALGGLLAVTTLLGIAARGCGAVRLVVHLDRWTPAGLRRLLDGALGIGLAASIGLSAAPAAGEPGGGSTPTSATLRRLPDAPSTTLRRLPDGPAPERSPPAPVATGPSSTLRRLADAQPSPPAPPAPQAPLPAASPPRSKPAAPVPSREVVVQPGDSFWRLAEREMGERLGRRPSEAEVGACWHDLVVANRHRLAVPGDPDLLFPGQALVVPPR